MGSRAESMIPCVLKGSPGSCEDTTTDGCARIWDIMATQQLGYSSLSFSF